MAYKVSYKVVAEQGEQLKKIAKDMDNYVNQLSQITSNLGGDELLVNVRNDLKKFMRQLEEEKTVLNLAGQVISEVIQSYSNVEKKSVQKVDRAKAHNRDFYKRPIAVASAGAAATASASATATATAYASGGQTNINVNSTVINQEVTNNFAGAASDFAAGSAGQGSSGILSGLGNIDVDPSVVATAAVAGMAAVGGAAAAQSIRDKKKEKKLAER